MSRTDKDDPYWVKVNDHTRVRKEHHDHTGTRIFCKTGETVVEERKLRWGTGQHYTYTYIKRHGYWGTVWEDECDVQPHKPGGWKNNRSNCGWSLNHREVYWHSAPPKWYRDHVYHNPERVRSRDKLREYVKEWNGSGDSDIEVEERQARHSAWWMWT